MNQSTLKKAGVFISRIGYFLFIVLIIFDFQYFGSILTNALHNDYSLLMISCVGHIIDALLISVGVFLIKQASDM